MLFEDIFEVIEDPDENRKFDRGMYRVPFPVFCTLNGIRIRIRFQCTCDVLNIAVIKSHLYMTHSVESNTYKMKIITEMKIITVVKSV